MYSPEQFEKFSKDRINPLTLGKFKRSMMPKAMTPMVIEHNPLNSSTISVFDRLMMDKIIFLGEEIDDVIANIINAQLLFLDSEGDQEDKDKDPIWLYINSPGGDVYSGLAIYDMMKAIKTPVYTCVMGMAASMAFVLAIAGKKKHRYALAHSRLMMHQPLGGVPYSQATDINIYNTEMQELKEEMIGIMALHTGKDENTIRTDADRDFYLTTKRAIEYGAIDKVLAKF